MSEIPTLAVPAALYDEALAFCNARLAEKGKPLIDALPAGEPEDATSCPCALACGARVYRREWSPSWNDPRRTDGHPSGFVDYFDSHARRNTLTLPVRTESVPS